jgi:predicted DNA-binding transcriptional regulator YafY
MNTEDDVVLNADEIALLLELLENPANIPGSMQSETIANARQKLSRRAELYHIIQDDTMQRWASVRLTLETAIMEKRIVSFVYTRYGGYHAVEPYRIVQASGVDYLVAGQQDKFRTRLKKYCLDFIAELEVTGRNYDIIPQTVAMKLATAKNIWFTDATPVKVIVEFNQRVAHFFLRKQFFPTQKIIEENEDGSIVIAVEVSNRMDFFLQSARWMPNFRVIHPPEFRQLIYDKALQTLERNKPLHVSRKSYQKHGILFTVYNSVRTVLHPLERFWFAVQNQKMGRIPKQ